LVDLDRLDDAQSAFERLVAFAPKHSRYLNELAYVLLKKKEWQHSIDAYRNAEAAATFTPQRRDYERCVSFRGIGYDLVELGRLDDAEAAYRKCLAIIPDEPKSLGEIQYIKEQRKKTT
jgi:tetratricopeptide (TPR) repeat protein